MCDYSELCEPYRPRVFKKKNEKIAPTTNITTYEHQKPIMSSAAAIGLRTTNLYPVKAAASQNDGFPMFKMKKAAF
jgi:hypothetical protein